MGTLEEEKLKDKISESDKEAITKKCEETIKWLDANQLAEVDEFQDKQKEVEGVCSPIISKLYQQAGGAPGGMPGMPGGMPGMPGGMPGMPDGMPGGMPGGMPDAKGSAGPTIEEVD